MNLLNNFKKKRPLPERNIDSDLNQDSVNMEPQSEPVRRLNRWVIYGVGVIAILAMAAGFQSCSNPFSTAKKVQETPVKKEVLSDRQMKELEQKTTLEKKKNSPKGFNSSSQTVSATGTGKNTSSNSSSTTNTVSSSSSGSSSVSSSSSQPAPITPYEKYREDSKKAYYKRQLSDEENLASEKKKGQRSQIFFDLDSGKRHSDKEKANDSNEPFANRYYNDGAYGNEESEDEYIQVVNSRNDRR